LLIEHTVAGDQHLVATVIVSGCTDYRIAETGVQRMVESTISRDAIHFSLDCGRGAIRNTT
jgi:hypothetical protein